MAKMDSMLSQWHEMMNYLRSKHPTICRQWFEELRPERLDAGTLTVLTSNLNLVQQNYLSRCLSQFTEAGQAVTGKLIGVAFVNGDGKANGNGNGDHHAPIGRPEPRAIAEAPFSTRNPEDVVIRPPAPRGNGHGGTHGNGGGHGNGHSHGERVAGASPLSHGPDQIILSPDYAFGNFVTGPENSLAYAASVAVANQPGTAYNPLFIHGGVGLGKTHLLQAICQAVIEKNPSMKICYLSCERFVNDFLDCVEKGQMADFRARYRHVDLLVIDDIQFLSKRERTQEEFFHTFNELYQAKKQIVLSSDRPPSEIQELEERLVSRFQWGLVADVSRPTYETRVAIVRAKAKLRGIDMPDDVISFIAERIESNARELEGAINTIQLYAEAHQAPITLKLAQGAFADNPNEARPSQVKLQYIIDAVIKVYGVKLSELQSKSRQRTIAEPRQVCMYLARKRTRYSLQEIGGHFGGRDHTTVMHSISTVEDRIASDTAFRRSIEHIDDDITKRMNTASE